MLSIPVTDSCTLHVLQAGKLVPLCGPQPPFHHARLDAKSELLCSKDYWRRKPDRVYEDLEYEAAEGDMFVRCGAGDGLVRLVGLLAL